jgi:type II secretory pathway pseudopilin PulG
MTFQKLLPFRAFLRHTIHRGPKRGRSSTSVGATLIEMTVVVTIVGLVAAILVTRINTSRDRQKGAAVAKRLVAHVRYTQQMAMLRGKQTELRVYTDQNRYRCAWVGGGLLKDPLRGTDLDVQIGTGNSSGLTITTTGLPGGVIQFDYLGIPMTNGNPIQSKMLVVTLSNKFHVWIEPYSGKVYLLKSFDDD